MDNMKHSFTRAEIDARFAELARHLTTTPLPTEGGGTRTASADEFMFMHEQPSEDGRTMGFKHIDSRNYVFLIACRGAVSLHIPAKFDAFMRGTFDTFAA